MKKMIIISLVVLIVVAGGGFFAWKTLSADAAEGEKEVVVDVEALVAARISVETITTNLLSPNNYIIVAFDVQTSSLESKTEFEQRLPEMKSIAISTFNATEKNSLTTKEGWKPAIASLIKQFNEKLGEGEVQDIYVTDYKLQ